MITPEVVTFIKNQDAKGMSREATRAMLASQGGWSQENLDEAFAAVPLVFAAPTAQTPNPPQPVTVATPAPVKKGNPVMVLAIIGAVVLTLIAGTGIAYAFVPQVRNEVHFMVASPKERVALSLLTLSTEPERYDVTVSTETFSEAGEEPLEGFLADLVKQRSTIEVRSTVERIEGDTSSLPMRVRSTFTLTSSGGRDPMTVKGEAYADPATLLLRFPETIDLLFFTTEPLNGKWISLLEGSPETGDNPFGGELMASVVAGYTSYRDTLAYVITRAPEFLIVEETKDVRTINGETARRYVITIDTQALTPIILESPMIMSDRMPLEAREQLKEELPESLATLQTESTELWISEKTHYPVKWRSSVTKDVEALGATYTSTTETMGTISVPKESQPIEVPQKDLTIDEAFALMMADMKSMFDS